MSDLALNGEIRPSSTEKGQRSEASEDYKADTQIASEQTSNDESILSGEENTESVVQNGISECMANNITIGAKDSNDEPRENDSIELCQQNTLEKDNTKDTDKE